MPPISSICAWLAACARLTTIPRKTGISGAPLNSTSAATHDWHATTAAMASGTTIRRQRAGW